MLRDENGGLSAPHADENEFGVEVNWHPPSTCVTQRIAEARLLSAGQNF
jgi:hypothetical protein